ncbi:hypothetical protein S83_063756, partial [Arachis hypogaea]
TYATGTSAAPSYLPALQFTNKDPKGNVHEFNLIDGGICANNSILILSPQPKEQDKKLNWEVNSCVI